MSLVKNSVLAVFSMCLAASCFAQNAGIPAGGKWLESRSEDKMTAVQKIRFELDADNYLRGSDARPKVVLYCSDGKLSLGDFRPNARIAPPNRVSFWGRPEMKVRVRVDSSHSSHNWRWINGDFLAMDGDTVRQLIASNVFKIQFLSDDGPQIAEFSPGGLDLGKVKAECGLKPQKP